MKPRNSNHEAKLLGRRRVTACPAGTKVSHGGMWLNVQAKSRCLFIFEMAESGTSIVNLKRPIEINNIAGYRSGKLPRHQQHSRTHMTRYGTAWE